MTEQADGAGPGDGVREYLPLVWWTPPSWADAALAQPGVLLSDHAHLEREAARNALALMRRAPSTEGVRWTERLASVAQDEVSHLRMVTRELTKRGLELTRDFSNPYASALRKLVRTGDHVDDSVDRLLVSGLIELRSCERFALLGHANHELSAFFGSLEASEAGHYRLFVQLAATIASQAAVDARWAELLNAEAEIAAAQPPGPRIHSGPPRDT